MAFFKRKRFVPVIGRKSKVPEGAWIKCPGCKQAIPRGDIDENDLVCPRCNHHYRLPAKRRIDITLDPGSFEETHKSLMSTDPLQFTVGDVTYQQKVDAACAKTKQNEAIITGRGTVDGIPGMFAFMDFQFRGGSMGSVVGEKFCRAAEDAISERVPLVAFTASGGARMEEGILSLMQMAKTSDAVGRMREAGIPYIVVLTDPTSGGVWASYASLGDVTIAEPAAYVGFAGTRLIQGALKVELPEGFQRSEYQRDNGYVDQILSRNEIRPMLAKLLKYLAPAA